MHKVHGNGRCRTDTVLLRPYQHPPLLNDRWWVSSRGSKYSIYWLSQCIGRESKRLQKVLQVPLCWFARAHMIVPAYAVRRTPCAISRTDLPASLPNPYCRTGCAVHGGGHQALRGAQGDAAGAAVGGGAAAGAAAGACASNTRVCMCTCCQHLCAGAQSYRTGPALPCQAAALRYLRAPWLSERTLLGSVTVTVTKESSLGMQAAYTARPSSGITLPVLIWHARSLTGGAVVLARPCLRDVAALPPTHAPRRVFPFGILPPTPPVAPQWLGRPTLGRPHALLTLPRPQAGDMTHELSRGYWPSYNVAYFPKIYEASGYPDMVRWQEVVTQCLSGIFFDEVAGEGCEVLARVHTALLSWGLLGRTQKR